MQKIPTAPLPRPSEDRRTLPAEDRDSRDRFIFELLDQQPAGLSAYEIQRVVEGAGHRASRTMIAHHLQGMVARNLLVGERVSRRTAAGVRTSMLYRRPAEQTGR